MSRHGETFAKSGNRWSSGEEASVNGRSVHPEPVNNGSNHGHHRRTFSHSQNYHNDQDREEEHHHRRTRSYNIGDWGNSEYSNNNNNNNNRPPRQQEQQDARNIGEYSTGRRYPDYYQDEDDNKSLSSRYSQRPRDIPVEPRMDDRSVSSRYPRRPPDIPVEPRMDDRSISSRYSRRPQDIPVEPRMEDRSHSRRQTSESERGPPSTRRYPRASVGLSRDSDDQSQSSRRSHSAKRHYSSEQSISDSSRRHGGRLSDHSRGRGGEDRPNQPPPTRYHHDQSTKDDSARSEPYRDSRPPAGDYNRMARSYNRRGQHERCYSNAADYHSRAPTSANRRGQHERCYSNAADYHSRAVTSAHHRRPVHYDDNASRRSVTEHQRESFYHPNHRRPPHDNYQEDPYRRDREERHRASSRSDQHRRHEDHHRSNSRPDNRRRRSSASRAPAFAKDVFVPPLAAMPNDDYERRERVSVPLDDYERRERKSYEHRQRKSPPKKNDDLVHGRKPAPTTIRIHHDRHTSSSGSTSTPIKKDSPKIRHDDSKTNHSIEDELDYRWASKWKRQYEGCKDKTMFHSGDAYIEILPGVIDQLRRTGETKAAIESDRIVPSMCCSCSTDLLCLDDLSYMICPKCEVISPAQSISEGRVEKRDGNRHGVAIGFTYDTFYKVQSKVLQGLANGASADC